MNKDLLKVFPNPGAECVRVTCNWSLELYDVNIHYDAGKWCLDAESFNLYLQGFQNYEGTCESLAVKIVKDLFDVLKLKKYEAVGVTVRQTAHGKFVKVVEVSEIGED